MPYRYIAIEGNIGAGKSTLVRKMAARLNAGTLMESFMENPFLAKFYKHPKQYAFPLELSFIAERYQQMKEHFSSPDLFHQTTFSDYVLAKSLIFAKTTLVEDEYQLFLKLYTIMTNALPNPELIVYLHAGMEKLQRQIRKRGRDFEQDITSDYLKHIEQNYLDYFKKQSKLRVVIIDTSNIDFVENNKDFNSMLEVIQRPYPVGVTYA